MGKSQVTLLLAVIFSSGLSFGQDSALVSEAKKEVAQETAASASEPVATQQIVQQVTVPVVEQPPTVVTASPLTTSRAEELRKQRERMEIENEQKIVEKLEQSRMEDEQKRLQLLFGNGQQQQQEQKQEQKIEQAAPAVVAPAVAPAPVKSEEELKAEIAAQVRADLESVKKEEESQKSKARWSVGGVLSTLDYPDAVNVGSDFGAGIVVNWMTDDHLGIEFSAVFSQATIDESFSVFKEVNQSNWSVAPKYFFFDRAFTPVVGGIVSYTHREYRKMYQWGYSVTGLGNDATTDSLDIGLLVGVQFNANKNLSFGIDYRWLTNVETRYSEPRAFNRSIYNSQGYTGYRPLEEIDYRFINMSMSFMF